MIRRLVSAFGVAAVFGAILAPSSPPVFAEPPAHGDCAKLMSLQLPDVKIAEAIAVAAPTTGAVRVAHCRVTGVVGSEVKFALLLPDAWNGKFLMGGGGGFVGNVQNQAQTAVNAGYATVGTDTGHEGGVTDASWALNNLERRVNFGYLAVHRTAEVAKAIVREHYRASASRNYFSGCSNGGRQALMEAQRYPADFDGIVAGAPALDFTGIAAQFIKDIQAAFPDSHNTSTPMFSTESLKLIEAQILDKCDAIDGVKDGLIEDPRQCKVDVAALTGISDAQRIALKKIYAETTNQEGVIQVAQPVGGEGQTAGWAAWITGGGPPVPQGPSMRFAFGTQFFKYLVFNDPAWDYGKYDLKTFSKDTAVTASVLNATNPNLEAFKARGGKAIVWHGWSDPALTALGSIRYYDQVKARDASVDRYLRLFLMPGVLHCAGGTGPDNADWFTAIADWVEKDKAPDRVVARKMENGTPVRSRPLCAYPQHAVYKGSGSIDDESNFACK